MRDTREAIAHHPEADAFDVRASLLRIWAACVAHKLLIPLTCVFTIGLVSAYILIWPPIYLGKVLVTAEPEDDPSRDEFYESWNVFRKEELATEVELIKADPVLKEVVTDLGLTYDDVHHTFLRYASHLWVESWLGKKYRTVKEYFFPPPKTPYDPTPEQIELAKTLSDFKMGVGLEPVPDTHVGTLIVKGPSPRVAEIANKVAEVYLGQRQERYAQEARQASASLKEEVNQAYAELAAVENEMEDYYGENGLLLEFEKDKVEIGRLVKLRSSVTEGKATVATLEKSLQQLRQKFEREPQHVTSSRTFRRNELVERMRASRFELATQLEDRLRRFNPEAPEIKDVQHLITAIGDMLKNEDDQIEFAATTILSQTYEELRSRLIKLEADLEGVRAGLSVKQEATRDLGSRLARIPEKMKNAHGLSRLHDQLEKKYLLLHSRLMMAEVSIATAQSAPPTMRVVSPAMPPAKPWWPRKKLLLLSAGLVGLLCGVGLALLMDALQGRVTRYRLATAGNGLPVYAAVNPDRRLVKELLERSRRTSPAGNGHGDKQLQHKRTTN